MEMITMPKTEKREMSFNYPEIFKTARDRGKFSQKEYADKLRINVRSYERIEAGDTHPSADTLMRFLLMERWIEKKEHEVTEVERNQNTKPRKECISCHRIFILPYSTWPHERCRSCQGKADLKDLEEYEAQRAIEAEQRRQEKRAKRIEAGK